MSVRLGDWVRLPDYSVGQVMGTGYGAELTVLLSNGQVVTATEATVIPDPTSAPRSYTWPKQIMVPPGVTVMKDGKWPNTTKLEG